MSYGSGGLHVTSVNIFAVPSRRRRRKRICFITNVGVNPNNARELAESYRKRWNIETSYRVIKHVFLPRATSRSGVVRFFFFAFGVCLFNLYVLALLRLGRLSGSCSQHLAFCGLEFLFVFSLAINGSSDTLLCLFGFDEKCMEAKSAAPRGV